MIMAESKFINLTPLLTLDLLNIVVGEPSGFPFLQEHTIPPWAARIFCRMGHQDHVLLESCKRTDGSVRDEIEPKLGRYSHKSTSR